MIRRTLVLALGTAVFIAVVSISQSGHPVSPSTSFATSGAVWADLDCDGAVTIADPLQVLLEAGDLPGDGADFCPIVGTLVEAGGVERVIGDVNCDEKANAPDAVELLLDLAGIGATTGACPDVGAPVDLTLLATLFEIGDDWRDYGDAPEGAPTLYTTGAPTGRFPTSEAAGPSHETPFAFRLGEFETAEEAPRPLDSADDGLLLLEMNECATSSALVVVSLDGLSEAERDTPLTVNIFADWNRDGDWDEADGCADEWALKNFPLVVSGEPDFTVLAVDFPGGDQVDEFWMRFMLTDQAYDPAIDNLLPGETEDYLISGGQVFQPDDSAQPSGVVQPLGKVSAHGNQFLCRGTVVPHGGGVAIFDLEQTAKSFASGFKITNIDTKISQPMTAAGERAAGVNWTGARFTPSSLDANGQPAANGRTNVRIEVTIITNEDAPGRLEGPFIIDVSVHGVYVEGFKVNDRKNLGGSRYCAFYVDHLADSNEQGDFDGFTGGPGRAAVRRSSTGEVVSLASADPKFFFVRHGKSFWLGTDAIETNCRGLAGTDKTDCEQINKFSQYDKSSLTVFGSDGAVIAPGDLATEAGIKKITVPKSRRKIKIYTVKDDHDPPVQPIVIRVKGKVIFNGKPFPFWDYYRIVIVHEQGSKATQLQNEYMEGSVAFFFRENEATEFVYVRDGQTLVSQEASLGDAHFDDTEVICHAGGGQAVRHPFHSSFDVSSWGFILDYGGGQGSDVYFIPPSNQVARSVSGDPLCPPLSADNVTNFGPNSGFDILEAAACGDKVVFSELNLELDEFRLGAVGLDGSGLGPIPGGEDYRDPSCYQCDSETCAAGSTPGEGGRSDGGVLQLPCNLTCTQSLPAPKVILPADAPNVHIIGLAVSPDATKIAWYRFTPSDSQVWAGDFDSMTHTVSNQQQLTTEGNNFDPTWSPDGSQIAFASDRDGNFEIYAMFTDGSEQTNITNTPDADETEPSWQVP